jgi:hypothetical protein
MLEATGPYSKTVALALVEACWAVGAVNLARIKRFAQGEQARTRPVGRMQPAGVLLRGHAPQPVDTSAGYWSV